MLHEENGSLKKNLESKAVTAEVSQPEYLEVCSYPIKLRHNTTIRFLDHNIYCCFLY